MTTVEVEPTPTVTKPFDYEAYLKHSLGSLTGCKIVVRKLSETKFRVNWYNRENNNIQKSLYVVCELAGNGEVIVTTPRQ